MTQRDTFALTARGHSNRKASVPPDWHVSKGATINDVVRDAAGQVIKHYDEALHRLKKY